MGISIQDIMLDTNLAVCCGLIINELVLNSYKYAFSGIEPGAIRVELTTDENNQFILSVADNGVGFSRDMTNAKTCLLGLRLVSILADQLHATMEIDSTARTRFIFAFSQTE